tara:strand:+ start:899 stop:1111 length:213 start_codon:yes stop_codon:yes gene_type:complete
MLSGIINPLIYYWGVGLFIYLFLGLIFGFLEKIFKKKSISNIRSWIFSKKVGAFWVSGSLVVIIYPFLPW